MMTMKMSCSFLFAVLNFTNFRLIYCKKYLLVRHLLCLNECSAVIGKDLKMFSKHILKHQDNKKSLFLFEDNKMSLPLVSEK